MAPPMNDTGKAGHLRGRDEAAAQDFCVPPVLEDLDSQTGMVVKAAAKTAVAGEQRTIDDRIRVGHGVTPFRGLIAQAAEPTGCTK